MPNSHRPKHVEWSQPIRAAAPAIAPRTEPTRPKNAEGFLICIDMQPVFLAGIWEKERLHARCSLALAAAAGTGLGVIFTEQVPTKLGHTAADLLALCKTPEAMGKDSFSAFGHDKFDSRLHASGAKHLYLCGIETPICVYQTARDALKEDYRVTVLSDCVGARRPQDAAAVLTHLAGLGCTVLPAETVFYSLLKNAKHEFFRDYTALVKQYA